MLAGLDRVLSWIMVLAAVVTVLALTIGPEVIGAETDEPAAPASEPSEPSEPSAPPSGEALFADSCGGCHTLSAAGTSGSVGPNLDDVQPDAATVTAVVTDGTGAMPAFGGDLSPAEIDAIAQYVASSAGG